MFKITSIILACVVLGTTAHSSIVVTDSDWNVTMYQDCHTIKDIKKLKENGNNFVRATLDKSSGVGGCATDGFFKRQRAEIQTSERMQPGNVYEYTANVRFNNMIDYDAIFMQIHAKTGKNGNCHSENGKVTQPPIKLRMLGGLRTIAVEPAGWPTPKYIGPNVDVEGLFKVGQWTEVKIVLDLKIGESYADLYINGKKLMNKQAVDTSNSCIKPWGKLGLYRDNIQRLQRSNWEPISVDYDKVTLNKVSR